MNKRKYIFKGYKDEDMLIEEETIEAEEDIYSDEGMESLADDDEITSAELGFMKGYIDT